MRDFIKFLPSFWTSHSGKQIKELGIEAQLISFYLLTSPNSTMFGIYYLPFPIITHETRIPLERVSSIIAQLEKIDFCSYDYAMEFIWVHDMAFYQIGFQLKQYDKRVKCLNDAIKKLPRLLFFPKFFEKYRDAFLLDVNSNINLFSEAPSMPLRSKEKNKEKNKEKKKEKKKKIFMSNRETSTDSFKNQALQVLQFLNEKAGKAYRPVDTNLKLILARLHSGVSVGKCFQVVAKKTRDWKSDPKMVEYLRPATLFNATKFEQYLGEIVASRTEEMKS